MNETRIIKLLIRLPSLILRLSLSFLSLCQSGRYASRHQVPRVILPLVLLIVVVVGLIGTSKTSVATPPAAAPQAGTDYAGSDTCMVCHADQSQHFQNTVM